jgi:hypothetical protein
MPFGGAGITNRQEPLAQRKSPPGNWMSLPQHIQAA